MSTELEAAGALVTAELVAGELQGVSRGRGHRARGAPCSNCGAALAGAYCHVCGQSAHIHRSLLHLAEELLHGLLHFDAKGWRTVPLLIARPGLLTRRYIDGQRMRHVSPLALFLFTVFLMFFVFSFASPPMDVSPASAAERAQVRVELEADAREAGGEVAIAQAESQRLHQSGAGATDADARLAAARVGQRVTQTALLAYDRVSHQAASAPRAAPDAAAPPADANWIDELKAQPVDTGYARLDEAIRHALANPELTLYKLKNAASKFSFMLVPISLPFLWLMFFWRRDVALYDHAVFTLYSLSFMSLLFVAVALLSAAGLGAAAALAVVAVPPLHMFMQLRETYGLGWYSTLWRTCALLLVAGAVFLLFLLFIIAVTMG